jgi:hypothetical protein
MKFVPESEIENVLSQLENKKYFNTISNTLIEEQPGIIGYIESEGFDILTPEEKDLLWYCCLVIYSAAKNVAFDIPPITLKELGEEEDLNYDIVGENMKFAEMADTFFTDFEQEDLLAFVEDTLIPDEDDFITPVGRKVLFISLKSIIDVLK